MPSKDDLIEKIKKLLALSNAAGATDAEKDLALNRAKDLMAQHCIGEIDIKSDKVKELIEVIEYKPKLDNPMPVYLSNPALLNAILSPIAQNFGCYVAWYMNSGKIVFYGFKSNIEITSYACDVLLNAGIVDFRAEYRKTRSIGLNITFWNGFADGVAKRFVKLSNETALILYDKVKQKFESEITGVQIDIPVSTEAHGFHLGQKSATEAQLNPAVSKGSVGNLLK